MGGVCHEYGESIDISHINDFGNGKPRSDRPSVPASVYGQGPPFTQGDQFKVAGGTITRGRYVIEPYFPLVHAKI